MWPFIKKEPKPEPKKKIFYLAIKEKMEEKRVSQMIDHLFHVFQKAGATPIVFVCVGSDRSVGDSLGPLVGTYLEKNQCPYPVYGTLKRPVHALNLDNTLKHIKKKYDNPFIFGLDASLGEESQIGIVFLKEGSFYPGKALNKKLPEVGHYHIKGIVNYYDSLAPRKPLNEARLYVVNNMAEVLADLIVKAIMKFEKQKESLS